MARIRSVKPDYFDDEELAAVSSDPNTSRSARLLFAGLWCQADKRGRLEDRPARLRARLFPYDSDIDEARVNELLELLARGRFIVRYQVGDVRCLWVRSFEKHQHVNVREPESRLPAPPAEHPPSPTQAPAEHPTGIIPASAEHPLGTESSVPVPAEQGTFRGDRDRERDLESTFSLPAPAREEPAPELTEADRAGAFVRWYADEAYPRLRGRPYVKKPVRDYGNAMSLVQAFTDDAHLRRVAEFYLTTDHRDAARGSRTIGQFAALASWCDEQLTAGVTAEANDPARPPPAIAAFLAALELAVAHREWFTWLKPCQLARDDGEALTLVAPTADHARYVSTHYAGELTQAGERAGRRVVMTSADEVAA